MSDPTLQPIWTPEDFRRTVQDAAMHDRTWGGEAVRGRQHLPTGTPITWKPYFDEPFIPGIVIGVIDDSPSFPLLYRIAWTDDKGRIEHTNITPERVLSVVEQPDAGAKPFWRNTNAMCPSCSAWPREACEANCLSRMTPEQQEQHRAAVLDGVLDELNLAEASTPIDPPAGFRAHPVGAHRAAPGARHGRHRVELVIGMRPRHAMLISRVLIAAAVLVLVAAVAAVWAMGVAR